MSGRDFSMSGELPLPERRIDDDAPNQMRVELLHAAFSLAGETDQSGPTERALYDAIAGSLGVISAVNPYGGLARRASQHLWEADWPRAYDVIIRLGAEFSRHGRLTEFRSAVNPILAAHAVVWEVNDQGGLTRVLPAATEDQLASAIQELNNPDYEAARELFGAGQFAYNAVPRRDRDACANLFDAMEAVGRIRFGGSTFGQVLNSLESLRTLDRFTLKTLRSLETTRHNHFGHGSQQPFNLSAAEVDFVYLACVAGILLLIRTPR